MLTFNVNECPSLIKKSLHELFPAPEVVSSEKLTLMTLRFQGETEQGARKVRIVFISLRKSVSSKKEKKYFFELLKFTVMFK